MTYPATSVLAWARRIAIAVAATLALSTAALVPAYAADTEGPVITNASVSDPTVDVIDGPAQVTVRIEVDDELSGVAEGYPVIDPLSFNGGDPIGGQTMTLVSGNFNHGIYEATITFPELVRSGSWTFVAQIIDRAGNRYVARDGGAFDSIGVYVTVESAADTTGPNVSASLSSTLVDITDGPAEAVATADVYDDGIGIAGNAEIMVIQQFQSGTGGWYVTNTSPDPKVARFKASIAFPQYDPTAYDVRGTHQVVFSDIADRNGNYSSSSWNYAGEITVATRPLRAKRPDLRTSRSTITASWTEHQDPLGILEYETEFSGPDFLRTVKSSNTEALVTDVPAAGTYTARVRARNQLGWGEWTTSSTPVEHSLASITTGTPKISGTARAGQTLSVSAGEWSPEPSAFTYQWLADGANLPGATDPTIVLGAAEVGKAISVRITGSKVGYANAMQTSIETAAVEPGSFDVAPVPVIEGEAVSGKTLTARAGSWSPVPSSLSYEWFRDGAVIAGASTGSLVLGQADVGSQITVAVTASRDGFQNKTTTSAPTTPIQDPPPAFKDVPTGALFATEIQWMSDQGISTGWPDKTFRPLLSVNRDAMAAFMYRLAGSPSFTPPTSSPFIDVQPETQFYKEITWLASKGISTGWTEADGSKTFRPIQTVNRDAMAAFMYRFGGSPTYTAPDAARFADVPKASQFYKEIAWLSDRKISAGWTEDNTFRPLNPVNRDAMAAFMYRFSKLRL